MIDHVIWWAAGGLILGSIAGSFIATLVIRWPLGQTLSGRSRCDGCAETIRAADLIPIISYIVRRGQCRNCGVAIDRSHLAIEVMAAMIGGIAFSLHPNLAGLAGALFGWQLLTLAALDLNHFWLPDRLTLLLAGSGLVLALVLRDDIQQRAIGGLAGFSALFAIACLYKRIRGVTGLGAGDPKLLGAIGCWTGWQSLPLILTGACLIGLLAVAIARLRGTTVDRMTRVPLGALMAIAAFPVWLVRP